MHIDVRGTGPALVMLHGWAMHGGIFASLVDALADEFSVHVVDLPGHGHSRGSQVPLQLDALARHLVQRTPPALWLGWSLGGLLALQAAQQCPTAVTGLAMLCASPRFVRAWDWPAGMPTAVFSQFAADLEQDYRGTLDRFLMLEAQGSEHMRAELRQLRDALYARGEPEPQVLCTGLGLLENSDLRAGLPALAMPSLWLAGRRDRLVSPAAMQAAAMQAPRSRYVEIAGGGHAPFLTHGEEVLQAVRDLAGAAHLHTANARVQPA